MTAESGIWLIESPVSMVAGEEIAYSVDWQGATYVSAAQAQVYKNGVEITAAAMPAGAHAITGNVLTLKKLQAAPEDGGSSYVVVISASVDGNLERRKLLVQVVKPSAES